MSAEPYTREEIAALVRSIREDFIPKYGEAAITIGYPMALRVLATLDSRDEEIARRETERRDRMAVYNDVADERDRLRGLLREASELIGRDFEARLGHDKDCYIRTVLRPSDEVDGEACSCSWAQRWGRDKTALAAKIESELSPSKEAQK